MNVSNYRSSVRCKWKKLFIQQRPEGFSGINHYLLGVYGDHCNYQGLTGITLYSPDILAGSRKSLPHPPSAGITNWSVGSTNHKQMLFKYTMIRQTFHQSEVKSTLIKKEFRNFIRIYEKQNYNKKWRSSFKNKNFEHWTLLLQPMDNYSNSNVKHSNGIDVNSNSKIYFSSVGKNFSYGSVSMTTQVTTLSSAIILNTTFPVLEWNLQGFIAEVFCGFFVYKILSKTF